MKKSVLTIPFIGRFAKFLIITHIWIMSSYASIQTETSQCGTAVKAAIAGKSFAHINSHQCPLSALLISWLHLQEEGSFHEIQQFIVKHPDWPRLSLLCKRAEEQIVLEQIPSATIVAWFGQYPPLTAKGVDAYVQALLNLKRQDDAQRYLSEAWPRLSITLSEAQQLASKFSPLFTEEMFFARASNLLNDSDTSQTSWLLGKLSTPHQNIIKARIACQNQTPQCQQLIQNLTTHERREPGLVLDLLRWYRKLDRNDDMIMVLRDIDIPDHLRELYWKETNILIRRLMDDQRYHDAYGLAKRHGLNRGENFANAEWLAGWLALRFTKQTKEAISHFHHLLKNVSSPISVARASYWLGRAYDVIGNREQAKVYYAKAKQHPATYYGQLAYKQIMGSYPKVILKYPTISKAKRQNFEGREMVKIIHLLHCLNEKSLAEAFLQSLAQVITHQDEQVLLIQLAHEKLGQYNAVDVCKKSTRTIMPLIPAAYPRIDQRYSRYLAAIDKAFIHAIIRQESRFKHDAVSCAGAQGLMQLMPATAAQTAQKLKLKSKKLPLHDPKINVQLGSAHLKELLDRYQGSMILAAAAYNAGAHAVDRWLVDYGDPRKPGVDVTDWVETIPYLETRNYVQRVLENYHCYR
jgi:soluble lytic murein transglycosylase